MPIVQNALPGSDWTVASTNVIERRTVPAAKFGNRRQWPAGMSANSDDLLVCVDARSSRTSHDLLIWRISKPPVIYSRSP